MFCHMWTINICSIGLTFVQYLQCEDFLTESDFSHQCVLLLTPMTSSRSIGCKATDKTILVPPTHWIPVKSIKTLCPSDALQQTQDIIGSAGGAAAEVSSNIWTHPLSKILCLVKRQSDGVAVHLLINCCLQQFICRRLCSWSFPQGKLRDTPCRKEH